VSFAFRRSVGFNELLVTTSVDIMMQTLMVVKEWRDMMFRLSMVTKGSLKKVQDFQKVWYFIQHLV
jgi:hypothetical protein